MFLGEVGGMSPTPQAKSLRVLQDGEFEPLGVTATIQVDVRLLVATHKNQEQMVDEVKLYYEKNRKIIRINNSDPF